MSTTHKVELALHYAEHAAGIMSLVVIAIVAGSGALASFSIWRSIAPQWRRIARLAAGNIEDRPSALQPREARS